MPFLIAGTEDLDQEIVYAKERRLIECVKADLARGRKCQVFAVYTQKRDVTRRLEKILAREGMRVSVLTTQVPPDQREAWYEKQLRAGMQVCIAHPRLVSVGMDLLWAPSIYFYETGYSTYTLRQASRRSWRIGQRSNVVVRFLSYKNTMQTSCLRLMGKKLLVSMTMEGKFSNEGLQSMGDDDDILTAMARELVTEKNVGESAVAVWRGLQEQQREVSDVPGWESGPKPEATPEIMPSLCEDIPAPLASPLLIFGTQRVPPVTIRRRPVATEAECQLSLF